MKDHRPSRSDSAADALAGRIAARRATVGVIGLGYVGLPLAATLAGQDFPVLGFDVDASKVRELGAGRSYIAHIPAATVTRMIETGRFEASDDFDRLGEADVILMCVPTPLDGHREPDMSYVVATARAVAARLRAGQLVVLESTTYPGTTREVVRPILDAAGLVCEDGYFLAYSPEREDPGNPDFSTGRIPKVVGGEGPRSLALAADLYRAIVPAVVPVADTATAEAVKLTENIFRAVNIALVNELKQVYTAMGIDIWEVIEAASSKPFGYMPFYPGPGLGGHCIPIDPFYLTWKAREFEIPTRFIELSGEVNWSMPRYVARRLAEALNDRFARAMNGARVLLMGLAYKKNVDDIRESPAFKLIELLRAQGAKVDYYDPHVPEIPTTREHPDLAGRRRIAYTAQVLQGFDAVLICTDHDAVDYCLLAQHARLVVDTRNVMSRRGLQGSNVVKA